MLIDGKIEYKDANSEIIVSEVKGGLYVNIMRRSAKRGGRSGVGFELTIHQATMLYRLLGRAI